MGVAIVEPNTCIRGCCRSDSIPLHLPPSSYSLLNPIARGAESVVYEAVLDGNKVAVKKPILSTSDHIDKFHKELQMLCKLDHPGIATLVAAHAKPPNYMFFFKFYESLNLAEKLHVEEWNPTFDQVLTISVQLGGRSSLGKEVDEVDGDDVDMEFESGERELNNNNYKNKNKRLQKRNHSAEEDDLGSLFGDGISGKLPRFANKITLKNISPGMKLWGVIAEVNEKDIVISLPGGLRGLVRASEAFDPISDNKVKDVETNFLSSIYHVGQLVSCIVLQLGDDKKEKGKRKIWLSLRLALLHKTLTLDVIREGMVITAYVKSIEDHGYILHFGLPSFTGFMSKNSQAESREIRVNIGQLLQGVVKSVDKTRKVVYLSSDPDVVSKCVTKELKGISIDLLIPGMMVNACVQSTLENGIMLSFLTYFTGTVDIFHLQKAFPTSNWKDDYNQNKKVNARILFIDTFTRAVGLTLSPHLVHNKAPPFSSAFKGSVFTHSDVKPGMVVRAKVTVVDNFGAIVQFPSGVKSLCPLRHMSEFEIAKPRKKFQVGAELQFRVLGCKSKRITVTHKKTLVKSMLGIVSSY